MLENLRFAFQGIWAHKMRSFLTMLGVIIGIASIIAIVSTIKGTNEQIMENLIGAGNNNVTVTLRQGEDEYWMGMGAPAGVYPVTEDQIREIRSFEDVADASFYHYRSWVDGLSSSSASLSGGSLYGVDTHYLSTTGYQIYSGRGFTEKDYTNYRKTAVLDETAAEALFPEGDAIGNTLEIQGEPFIVVGLIRKAEEFKPVINSFEDYQTYYQDSASGTVLIPDADWSMLYQFDEPHSCVARAASTEAISNVGKEIAAVMNNSVSGASDEMKYKAEDLLEKAKNQQELSASTNNLLIWIASIALLVGGIGVMNIMLVSVTERTGEIGLKKALGARKRTILVQFLTESAMLTSFGGILGVIAGIILAEVISHMSGTPAAISIPSIILGVGFSLVIGIVFGLLPSVKAANLNPIDALRRE